ncbi:MAG: tryptophan 7-halogenase, partial [Planctomycetota bacterium]
LQKWLGPSAGAGFFLLPNAASTIDPMHSTGLAHTAAGVARVAHLLLQVDSDDVAARQRYQETIDREVRWLDQMIRLTYDHLHDFDAFVSATMPYFCAAICSEESLRSNWSAMQDNQRSLWTADDEGLAAALVDIRELLADGEAEDHRRVGELLQPWNTAGLCNMDANLRYRYTAASKT